MALVGSLISFTPNTVILSAEVNANFAALLAGVNSIDNTQIAANAGIVDTKLAQITTANKVNLSALRITSQATGDIIYASSGTVLTRLAAGASDTVLKGGTTPSWGAPPAIAGSLVQFVSVTDSTPSNGTFVTGDQWPFDNTIPVISKGLPFFNLSITPTSATNKLVIDVSIMLTMSGDVAMMAALFQDATANAIASASVGITSDNKTEMVNFRKIMVAGTTSATNFSVRFSTNTNVSWYKNSSLGGSLFGGTCASTLTISEIKV